MLLYLSYMVVVRMGLSVPCNKCLGHDIINVQYTIAITTTTTTTIFLLLKTCSENEVHLFFFFQLFVSAAEIIWFVTILFNKYLLSIFFVPAFI